MVITDISSHEIRADALGKLGISYGLGMIVGPFLGGFITAAASEEAAAATAAVGSLLSVALVLAFIPSNTKQSQISEGVKENDGRSSFLFILCISHIQLLHSKNFYLHMFYHTTLFHIICMLSHHIPHHTLHHIITYHITSYSVISTHIISYYAL